MMARSLPLDDVLGEGDRRISVDGDLDKQTNKQTDVNYNMVGCHATGGGVGTMRGTEARVQSIPDWRLACSSFELDFRYFNLS